VTHFFPPALLWAGPVFRFVTVRLRRLVLLLAAANAALAEMCLLVAVQLVLIVMASFVLTD